MNEETSSKRYDVGEAARTLKEVRSGIVLTGRVVNGRVELDQSTLEEIAHKYADAEISFVAVNAPFDPQSPALAS